MAVTAQGCYQLTLDDTPFPLPYPIYRKIKAGKLGINSLISAKLSGTSGKQGHMRRQNKSSEQGNACKRTPADIQ
jgi:hypothetical protein